MKMYENMTNEQLIMVALVDIAKSIKVMDIPQYNHFPVQPVYAYDQNLELYHELEKRIIANAKG